MTDYHVKDRPPSYMRERESILAVAVGLAMLGLVLCQVTTREIAFTSTGALFVFYALLGTFWKYRRTTWFWVTMAVFAVLHAAAIILIPFRFPAGSLSAYVYPAMMIDGFVMFGILKLLASKMSASGD